MQFTDPFDYNAGWTDATSHSTDNYDDCGVTGGFATIPDCFTRPGTVYIPANANDSTIPPGEHYGGIGYKYRDFGAGMRDNVEGTVRWNGVGPYEATPLLHVTTTSILGGIGAWTAHEFLGLPFVLVVATIGNPPELFGHTESPILAISDFAHVDGTPRDITCRSIAGQFSVLVDGVAQTLLRIPDGAYVDSVTIPAELQGSSLHGFALDHHFDPDPNVHAIASCSYRNLANRMVLQDGVKVTQGGVPVYDA